MTVILSHFPRFLAFSFFVLAAAIRFPAHAENAPGSINSLDELFAALRRCWVPPPVARSRDGMEITVRFSISRYGESRDASDEERLAYRVAVAQAIERCTPFPIIRWQWNKPRQDGRIVWD
jgi:hypothetical protein